MSEQQFNLPFDAAQNIPTFAPAVVPELRDEIARAWGLPLGERVEIRFRGGQLDAATGLLELLTAPDFPWDSRQPLQLRLAGFTFGSRDIESWTRL